jgi:acetyltransferase-like isoleucine patch superfamily enzyme
VIEFAINLLLFLRYWFWKTVIKNRGGKLKKGTRIYERVKIYSTKQSPVVINEDCVLQTGVILAASDAGKITLDRNVYLGEYTVLSSKCDIHVGENSIIATHSFIVDFNHRFDNPDKPIHELGFECDRVSIGKNTWIAAGCKILKGVTIGDGCVIGAGSVVTKDIPAYSIAVGVPAKVIKKREKSV